MSHRTLLFVMLALGLAATNCGSNDAAVEPRKPPSWPPQLGQPYPDLQLTDATGNRVRLSDHSGKVLLIEPIGVDCPACQAFAGAHRQGIGPLRSCTPQRNLQSIEEYIEQHAGVSLDDPRMVYVQLLLYDWTRKGPPTLDEAREWAEHFGASRRPNQLVLIAASEMIGPASYAMVPGFQLVDTAFVLRFDSTGHNPHHNLWTDLLPGLPALLDAVPVGTVVGQPIGDFTLPDACRRVREDHGLPGTLLADADGAVCGRFGVGDFTVFEVDAAGFIRFRGSVDKVRG